MASLLLVVLARVYAQDAWTPAQRIVAGVANMHNRNNPIDQPNVLGNDWRGQQEYEDPLLAELKTRPEGMSHEEFEDSPRLGFYNMLKYTLPDLAKELTWYDIFPGNARADIFLVGVCTAPISIISQMLVNIFDDR